MTLRVPPPPPGESELEAGALRISLCALERFSPSRGVCHPGYSEDQQRPHSDLKSRSAR